MVTVQIPLAEGLFTWPSPEPALIAGRVLETGELMFPRRSTVMLDDGSLSETEVVELPRRGTLWSFTTQSFTPPTLQYAGDRTEFVPFAVGYVELPGALRVETRLTEPDPDKLHIGQEMELVVETLAQDDNGDDIVMFAFAPVADPTTDPATAGRSTVEGAS